ncbi:hypothetical protein CQW23_02102 [Capsicum baccatum]|uniref:Uncharacterized protein n=1 Tax=Capsicum baccatum TaxID=33114 RepID=A0A2G2XQL0_CAPBA|nr:hypothetical protein CQW23_02102 [Capsicum baccatum]
MSIDIPDATNNLNNLNTDMEDNDLDDANNKVNGLFCRNLENEVNDDVLSKACSRFPSFNMAKLNVQYATILPMLICTSTVTKN